MKTSWHALDAHETARRLDVSLSQGIGAEGALSVFVVVELVKSVRRKTHP